jgi:DTW domain-containing protein
MSTQETCPSCEKPMKLCVCSAIAALDNRVFVLILRHPQEQDRALGTAKITTLQLKNSLLKTGLSWRNLGKILGRDEDSPVDPKRWGVLYLGTAKTAEPLPPRTLTVVTKKGGPAPDQDQGLKNLEGIILLDGNWQQAKALWWRNAWLLKCRRLVLQPPQPSLYGNLRKEPRRESVSTLEAAAYTLAELDHNPDLADKILVPFRALLENARKSDR